MKKLLINDKVEVNCYPEYAFIFSLLRSSGDSWVMNNFIQTKLIPEWEYFIAYKDHEELLDKCPFLTIGKQPICDLANNNIDIIDYINDLIERNVCSFLYLDRFYVKSSPEFARIHYIHNTFVVGNDVDKKIIYLADNFQEGKYSIIECSFDDFRSAFYQNREWLIRTEVLDKEYNDELIPYVANMIDRNGKAFAYLDRMYVKGLKTHYQFAHDIEIIQYNHKRKKFKIVSNYYKRRKIVNCSYDEMKNAYRKDPKQASDGNVQLIQKHSLQTDVPIDPAKILRDLEDYVHPQTATAVVDGYNYYYGLPAIEEVIKFLEKGNKYRYRLFHFMYEHKMLMEKRVNQLMQLGIMESDDTLMRRFSELSKKYRELRNKAVKISLLKTESKERLDENLKELKNEEENCILSLIESLKKAQTFHD